MRFQLTTWAVKFILDELELLRARLEIFPSTDEPKQQYQSAVGFDDGQGRREQRRSDSFVVCFQETYSPWKKTNARWAGASVSQMRSVLDNSCVPSGLKVNAQTYASWSSSWPTSVHGAANPGTINLTPAAGDLGLGQFQFFNAMILPNESFLMLQVNLVIDQAQATPGAFPIFLNLAGQNSLDAFDLAGDPNSRRLRRRTGYAHAQ